MAFHKYIYINIYISNTTLQNPTNTWFISLANNKLKSVIILMNLSKLNSSAYSENCHNIWRHYWSHEDHHPQEYPANFRASKNIHPKVKHDCPTTYFPEEPSVLNENYATMMMLLMMMMVFLCYNMKWEIKTSWHVKPRCFKNTLLTCILYT